ncbi:MAG TPA: hypothetical protein VER57_07885, partial [Cyanobium sp.]|nr:hypothetical protein [Cyanobium sp.]
MPPAPTTPRKPPQVLLIRKEGPAAADISNPSGAVDSAAPASPAPGTLPAPPSPRAADTED